MTAGGGEYDFSTWLGGGFGGETNYGRRIFILLFFVEKKGAKKATRKRYTALFREQLWSAVVIL